MRKYQQRRILQMIDTFREVLEELERLSRDHKYEVIEQLLEDCREGTAGIREYIGEVKGDGTRTDALLEEYKAKIALALETRGQLKPAASEAMGAKLREIRDSVENELAPDIIEVVFLPYKASMWDAMESVWLAAQADPRCVTHVVPIPYFDRQSNGQLGQMHDESGQYPAYVPIVGWYEYNTKEHYPDAIFVFSPYDEWNIVTTVHPYFYNKTLKEQTDMLCYIPYFVTGLSIGDNFCVCAGTQYAHKVFIESVHIRDMYINAFEKFERANNCVGTYGNTREKFIASGSPKYDKVVRAREEEFTLPEAWKKRLMGPDGRRKKAVLYNTSLGSILRGNRQYIKKLQSVIKTFNLREDAVLWWRPHPLSDATFSTMLPGLRDEYLQVIEDFKREGRGIFDDTADLHRALCLSDAFYGDASSLVPMYQLTGKPLMRQNPLLRPGERNPSDLIALQPLCDTGEDLWFMTYNTNALWRMDKANRALAYMGSAPGESVFAESLSFGCAYVGRRIYMAPHSGNALIVYDTESGEFDSIPIPEPSLRLDKGKAYLHIAKFIRMFEHKGLLYMIPSTYPGILVYDTQSGAFEVIDGWVEELGAIIMDPEASCFYGGIMEEAYLLLACGNTDAVILLDLATRQHSVITFSGEHTGYMDIYREGNGYWLLPKDRASLIHWEPERGMTTEYEINTNGVADAKFLFQSIVRSGDGLLLVPMVASAMIRFDLPTKQFSLAHWLGPKDRNNDSSAAFNPLNTLLYGAKVIDGKLIAQTGYGNTLMEYDLKTEAIHEEGFEFPPETAATLREMGFSSENHFLRAADYLYAELPFAQLPEFLDQLLEPERAASMSQAFIRQRDLWGTEIVHPDGHAGEEIYSNISREVFGE